MGFIGIILLIIFIITSLLLIVLVLLQDEQGEGLGGIFGGGSSTPFGSRSGNVLTRATSILGAIFLISSLALAWVSRTPESEDVIGAARRGALSAQEGIEWWDTTEAPAVENAKGTGTQQAEQNTEGSTQQ